jgi:hypothetical protein
MSESQAAGQVRMVCRGTVRGGTIVLDEALDLPDGTRVTVEIVALPKGEISEEDRAILEHVYRERGCGVEREP